jgi:hypothetical protein
MNGLTMPHSVRSTMVKKKYSLIHKTMVEATKKRNKLLIESLHKIHGRIMVTQDSMFSNK